MELVLSDSKGLYHKHNTRNISWNCDVESIAIGPWYLRDYDTGVMKTYIAALYYVKPNANIKLLPVDDVYNNLLEYYKLGIEKRRVKIRELDIDFYSDRDLKPNDEEEKNQNYIHQLFRDLRQTLESIGMEEIFERNNYLYSINPDKIDCDYFNYLKFGKPEFIGEYMSQYSWAEETCGLLWEKKSK